MVLRILYIQIKFGQPYVCCHSISCEAARHYLHFREKNAVNMYDQLMVDNKSE